MANRENLQKSYNKFHFCTFFTTFLGHFFYAEKRPTKMFMAWTKNPQVEWKNSTVKNIKWARQKSGAEEGKRKAVKNCQHSILCYLWALKMDLERGKKGEI
jgi:hypothetical protein